MYRNVFLCNMTKNLGHIQFPVQKSFFFTPLTFCYVSRLISPFPIRYRTILFILEGFPYSSQSNPKFGTLNFIKGPQRFSVWCRKLNIQYSSIIEYSIYFRRIIYFTMTGRKLCMKGWLMKVDYYSKRFILLKKQKDIKVEKKMKAKPKFECRKKK